MKVPGCALLAILAGFGVSLHAQTPALPVQAVSPSPEQTRLATQMLQASSARANAKALVDKMLAPTVGDLDHDYPELWIAEWADQYADQLAEAQYQQTLADLAQMDVQQLREMAASATTDRGKAVLAALEGGDLSGQLALSRAIDQADTPTMRQETRLELLKGACAQIACPSEAQREIARGKQNN